MTEEKAKIGFPPKTTPYEDWCKIIKGYEKQLTEKDKQIEELEKMLAEQYPDLKQSLDWANEREKELEAQIEKMKCCYNCEEFSNGCSILPSQRTSFSCDKWELAE